MFNKYIYAFNGQEYGDSVLNFGGGKKRFSTKYKDGKCPYQFLTWFFNDATSLKCICHREPKQWVNIYNYNLSYSKTNYKLIFTCDVTWKFSRIQGDNPQLKPVWQKLNDTT